MRTAPPSLGTTTIAAHQGVGAPTGDITHRLCMRCNSACTFALSGSGMFLGAFGLSVILYSCVNVPSPVNKEGYCDIIL